MPSLSEGGSSRSSARAATVAAGLAVLPHALDTLADPDLWWHVRSGLLILAERAIPRQDPFSFTAAGRPWTNHEWLTDVVFAWVYRASGGSGLTVLRIALLVFAAALWMALLRRRSGQPLVAAATLAVGLTLFAGFVNVRAHSFTYLLTLGLLLVLEWSRENPARLFVLPPLLALWANLHGGFVLGVGLALYGVTRAAFAPAGDGRRLESRRAAALIVLCAAAALLNPRGIELLRYVWRELGADHATVSEWKSVAQLPRLLPVYLACALPPLVAIAVAGKRIRRDDIVLCLASAILAWRHLRFLPLLVIFGSLVVAAALGHLWRRIVESRPSLATRFGGAGAIWTLCALLTVLGAPRAAADFSRKGLALEIDRVHTPVLAVRVLSDLDLGPNLATRLDWGGYAIFHLWPRYRVSIDGRNVTVYPEAFVAAQIAAYDRGEPLAGLAGLPVDAALVESQGPGFDGMARLPGWQLVFRDPAAAVFVPVERLERLSAAPAEKEYELREPVLAFP